MAEGYWKRLSDDGKQNVPPTPSPPTPSDAQTQAWRQPYTVEDFGVDFTAQSGWFAIADRGGPLVMTEGLVEIMLLDANLKYPRHSHSPEELYIVLAGEVWWEAEGDPKAPSWRRAGEVNPPSIPSSSRTNC